MWIYTRYNLATDWTWELRKEQGVEIAHFSPAWKGGNAINNRGITVEGADMGNDGFSFGLSI